MSGFDPEQRCRELIEEAACLWFSRHDPAPEVANYSTARNEFLHAAEAAWFAMAEADPRVVEDRRRSAEHEALRLQNGSPVVYRIWDGRTLVYIGISEHVAGRLRQHRKATWWKDRFHVTTEVFASRAAAVDAEERAIASEWPLANIAGKPGTGVPYAVGGTPLP